MAQKMRGVTLHATWAPKPGFKLGAKDIDHVQTYLGSQVWKDPYITIDEYDIPEPGPGQVLIKVKACGICGSDVHMAQAKEDGYIFYPGLTGFPCILGHELSGVVVKGGPGAKDKVTNKPFKGGEMVCAEEMLWCGSCKPCADGWPNHCERLDEIGFNVNGAFCEYIVLPDRCLWSLEPLRRQYKDERDIFLAGSLVEPCSVGYNAVIERGGGIRPGDNVVICGTGPVGLAACRELKTMGGATVIVSEPQPERAALALKMGADYVIDPTKVDFTEEVLRLTAAWARASTSRRPACRRRCIRASSSASGRAARSTRPSWSWRAPRPRCPSPAKCCRCAARASWVRRATAATARSRA